MYKQQKRYNAAMERFSVVIKAGRGWRGSAASSCNAFAIATFLVAF